MPKKRNKTAIYYLGPRLEGGKLVPLSKIKAKGRQAQKLKATLTYFNLQDFIDLQLGVKEYALVSVGGEPARVRLQGDTYAYALKHNALLDSQEGAFTLEASLIQQMDKATFDKKLQEYLKKGKNLEKLLKKLGMLDKLAPYLEKYGKKWKENAVTILLEIVGLPAKPWSTLAFWMMDKAAEAIMEAIFGDKVFLKGSFKLDASNLVEGYYVIVSQDPDAKKGEHTDMLEFKPEKWSVSKEGNLTPPPSYDGEEVDHAYMIVKIKAA